MPALDWFESIAELRRRVAKLEEDIESAYAAAGPHGQVLGSVGGSGGSSDAFAGVDHVVDANLTMERDKLRARLEVRMERATDVLYGESGNGGVAKAIGTDDADMLCFHYLQGASWASIGRLYNPDAANLTTWCKRRAAMVCRRMDQIGMDRLADS